MDSNFETLLVKCREVPGYLYKSHRTVCVCGCDEYHNPVETIIEYTDEQISTLVREGHVDLSKSQSYEGWHVFGARRIVEVLELFLRLSPKAITSYRSDLDHGGCSILTSFYCRANGDVGPFIHRAIYNFAAHGMDFSDHYWMLWAAIRGRDPSIIEFLLTHGMSVEECLRKDESGVTVSKQTQSLIGEAIVDMIECLKSKGAGRNDYCDVLQTLKILHHHGLVSIDGKTMKEFLISHPNPYWDWSTSDLSD